MLKLRKAIIGVLCFVLIAQSVISVPMNASAATTNQAHQTAESLDMLASKIAQVNKGSLENNGLEGASTFNYADFFYQAQLTRYNRNGSKIGGICNISALTNLLNRRLIKENNYNVKDGSRFDSRYVFYESSSIAAKGSLTLKNCADELKSMGYRVWKEANSYSSYKNFFYRDIYSNFDSEIFENQPVSKSLQKKIVAKGWFAVSSNPNNQRLYYVGQYNMPSIQSAFISELKNLLNKHPEGVLIGYNYGNGPHKVLLTGYNSQTFSIVDTGNWGTAGVTTTWENRYNAMTISGVDKYVPRREYIDYVAVVMNSDEISQYGTNQARGFFTQEQFAANAKNLTITSSLQGNSVTINQGQSAPNVSVTIKSGLNPVNKASIKIKITKNDGTYNAVVTPPSVYDKTKPFEMKLNNVFGYFSLPRGTYTITVSGSDNLGGTISTTFNFTVR